MKLAVVGGGSTYTPELADGLGRLQGVLAVDEVTLIDPVRDRLALVAGVSQRILSRLEAPTRVRTELDLEAGVADADAVLVQLRVGGQAARVTDETWPLECGCIGQETTGAGGLAKALRTVPVVLGIAERVRRHAPDAWIVDFTNPVGIVTRALLDEGHRAVGLCNVAIGFQRRFAELLGVPWDEVVLDHVGLNHLTWERGVTVGGVDRLPELLVQHGATLAAQLHMPLELLRLLGSVPSYYLRYFYCHDQVVREQLAEPSRAEVVAGIEAELLRIYADSTVDEKPELLSRRGGAYYSEAAVQLVAALLGEAPGRHVVNVRNGGRLPNLAADAVVEVPARVDSSGIRVEPGRALPPAEAGLVAHVSGYEELALDAARRGGVDRVVKALLAHPLVGQYDLAQNLADRLIAANRQFLPWTG
jgi:6-phospho-beta-glucosidase